MLPTTAIATTIIQRYPVNVVPRNYTKGTKEIKSRFASSKLLKKKIGLFDSNRT
jgi:hypothetical protein